MDEKIYDNLLFGGLSREELDGLRLDIELEKFEAEDVVFEEGDPGKHMYLIVEGSVRISKKGRGGQQEMLSVENAGGFFGEMALLDSEPRSARATACEPTVLGRLDSDGLHRFLAHSPDTALHFACMISRHLRSLNSTFIQELVKSERMSLVGTMMSSIVHDFRNPLATISLVSEYLNSQKEDSTMMELGCALQDSSGQMLTMIQELLDFSKGTSSVDLKTIPVTELMRIVEDQMLKPLRTDGIETHIEMIYDGDITVDKLRISRVFANVIKNAHEAMGEGGRLTIRVNRRGERVEFDIEDTGCGIPPDVLPNIFDPFVTHGKKNGTGLGMAICRNVVEDHRGSIWMESEVGEGTKTHIALPVSP